MEQPCASGMCKQPCTCGHATRSRGLQPLEAPPLAAAHMLSWHALACLPGGTALLPASCLPLCAPLCPLIPNFHRVIRGFVLVTFGLVSSEAVYISHTRDPRAPSSLSSGILKLLMELDRQAQKEGGGVYMLNGNHGEHLALPAPPAPQRRVAHPSAASWLPRSREAMLGSCCGIVSMGSGLMGSRLRGTWLDRVPLLLAFTDCW